MKGTKNPAIGNLKKVDLEKSFLSPIAFPSRKSHETPKGHKQEIFSDVKSSARQNCSNQLPSISQNKATAFRIRTNAK